MRFFIFKYGSKYSMFSESFYKVNAAKLGRPLFVVEVDDDSTYLDFFKTHVVWSKVLSSIKHPTTILYTGDSAMASNSTSGLKESVSVSGPKGSVGVGGLKESLGAYKLKALSQTFSVSKDSTAVEPILLKSPDKSMLFGDYQGCSNLPELLFHARGQTDACYRLVDPINYNIGREIFRKKVNVTELLGGEFERSLSDYSGRSSVNPAARRKAGQVYCVGVGAEKLSPEETTSVLAANGVTDRDILYAIEKARDTSLVFNNASSVKTEKIVESYSGLKDNASWGSEPDRAVCGPQVKHELFTDYLD